jgi:hypothetical protein
MRAKYKQRVDGEGFEVPVGEVFRLQCCDCSLVHDVVVVTDGSKIGMAAKRNNRSTAQLRKSGSGKARIQKN